MAYKNPEDRKKLNKRYYLEHREYILQSRKDKIDPEDNKRRCKDWREKNKEHIKEYKEKRKNIITNQIIKPKSKGGGKSPARTPDLIKKMTDYFKANNDISKLTDISKKDDLEYSYPRKKQDREFELLQKKVGDITSKQSSNTIVLSNQEHYYETEKKLWKANVDNVRDKIIKNRKSHLDTFKCEYQLNDKDILRGFKISGTHIGFTHFNPLWIRWFVEQYKVKSIYDPCGGWGHRLLGIANKIDRYIYNDYDARSVKGCEQIAKNHNITNAIFYNKDSSTFRPPEDYEAVFTCPPYFNIEKYNNKSFKDKKDYKNWWDNTVKKALKDSVKYFSYVINHTHYDLLREVCEDNGLVFENEYAVGKALGHFSRKDISKSKKVELLVVFTPKKDIKDVS